jgi:acetylornithine deacetylase/succinyl-diaminopimelate desuccinylase family protein
MSRASRASGRADVADQVLAAVDDDETVSLLARLIETPSHNPPGDEAATAAALGGFLASAGITPATHEVSPGRPNLEASLGPGGGRVLLFNGHTDTMPPGPGWSTDPYRAHRSGGRLYGLGACDMKAGLAAMAGAMAAVARSGAPLRGQVVLDAVADEEATGAGTKATVRAGRAANWGVIAEPTGLQLVRAGNGQVNFTVTFLGEAGHGSTPEDGHNAIYDAAAFIRLVERDAARLAGELHPLTGPASYSVGVISGGVRTSIIPSECTVGVDRRIVPGQTVAEAVADLNDLLGVALGVRTGARARSSVDVDYEPFEVAERLPLCTALSEATAVVCGHPAGFAGLRATTDAVFLCEAGIPTVVFGPGSIAQAHRPDEYVEVCQVQQATRVFALTIARLLC